MSNRSTPGRSPCAAAAAILVITLLGLPAPSPAVAIGDLHCNDSSGRPRTPFVIGTPVTISGIVTAGTGTFTAGYTDIWLQDATGGMEVFQAGAPPVTFVLGDSFTVSGTIGQYRGNTEVILTSWTAHGGGHAVPEPAVVTCFELEHSYLPSGCEPAESELVRINRVTYSGTWPSSSGTVTLTDSTGSCTLFIDGDTGVQHVTPPGGAFDVIGILKQFSGFSPPFTSGYELLPRFPEDIQAVPGPRIVAGPVETDLQPYQVTLTWTTDVPADSRIDYGLTSSFELGSVADAALVTEHALTLTGLSPARIHHYRVQTANEFGITVSGEKLVCSASGPEAGGNIHVYFNKSVETSLSMGYPAQGNVNLPDRLIDRINGALHSIDICLYSFDLPEVTEALLAAANRGVLIRFVYENRTNYQAEVTRLMQNGIPVIDDAFGANGGSGLMHNKFWIFDHRNGSPDHADDWVWTGSLNVNQEGAFTDAQNVIEIQDAALAEIYQTEFEEMWGSSTQVPDPNLSRTGTRKLDNTPKLCNIAGVPARVYFSPSDGVIPAAMRQVRLADYSVHFSILSYTRFDLAAEMQAKWYGVPGFELRGVFDHAEIGNTSSQYHEMHGAGDIPWSPPADVWLDLETGSLHHKYLITDVHRHGAGPTVITGSSNWSTNAEDSNDENMLIVEDFAVADQYYQEFASRYHAAGGYGDLTTEVHWAEGSPSQPGAPVEASMRVTPNPTSRRLDVHFSLPRTAGGVLALYAPDGRQESVLFQGDLPAGNGSLSFDLGPSGFSSVATGVHFLRLELGTRTLVSRVLILR